MTDWTAMLAELEQKRLRELWRIAEEEGITLGSARYTRGDAAGAIVIERRARAEGRRNLRHPTEHYRWNGRL